MTLSITDKILNLQQSPSCKWFLLVGRDYATIRDASKISAEVTSALIFTECEKYNFARLEREAGQPDDDFEQVVRKVKGKNKGDEGKNSNVKK